VTPHFAGSLRIRSVMGHNITDGKTDSNLPASIARNEMETPLIERVHPLAISPLSSQGRAPGEVCSRVRVDYQSAES
jgi:hypothetical protein